jgi:hypothetical protein
MLLRNNVLARTPISELRIPDSDGFEQYGVCSGFPISRSVFVKLPGTIVVAVHLSKHLHCTTVH